MSTSDGSGKGQPSLSGAPDVEVGRAFTFRAFFTGAVCALIIALGVPYSTYFIRGSYMDLDFSTPAAVFLFFILTFGVNPALARSARRRALTPPELMVVYVMMVVACSLPTMGFTAQVLPTAAAPFYFANAGNRWAELIQPHIPTWLAPRDPAVVAPFFEGFRRAGSVPWAAWVVPVFSWLAFVLPFYFVSTCAMVLLRRQWANRERLAYPLTHLPLELMADDGRPVKPIYRNPILWLGFAIPFIFGSLRGLHQYFPTFPLPVLDTSVPMFRNTGRLILRTSFPMIGFFYLVNLETTFSLWFFNILASCVRAAMAVLGVEYKENLDIYGASSPMMAHLGVGAMFVLVFSGLYYARPHLRDVWDRVVRRDSKVDDSDEVLSYRTAFWGMCLGLVWMGVCLWLVGMPALVVPVLLVAAFVLFVGLTRVVVESGLAEAVAAGSAMGFTVSSLGAGALGPKGLVAIGLCYVWAGDIRTFVMASVGNSLRMADIARPSRRPLLGAIFLAIGITLAASIPLTIYLAYHYGGLNLNSWFFQGGARGPWDFTAGKINNPAGPAGIGWALKGLGALVMLFLTVMRQRYLWWPFHPIGFAVGATWIMDQIWFSAFVCWLIKLCIVRYGGLRGFRRARPAFLGLILGQFTCNGTWLVIDAMTGMKGNMIFWI
ncbi:MAG: hypothetical protein HY321_05660 [Armatimonadetes bacterium]|nr:hypothetical protein [Armatimonadota bacterium]